MSQRLNPARLADLATITAATPRFPVDRNFGLPTVLYAATVACYFAFLGTMAVAFSNPELAIPMGICVIFIAMAFGFAGKWATMAPANNTRAPRWDQFRERGIMTAGGRLGAGEAAIQVLTLPVLIVVWGLLIVVIRATV